MTNQSDLQASVRALTGTAWTYEGDFEALFDGASIPKTDFNGRLLAWINQTLGAGYTEINGAKQAYASALGFYNWNALNTVDPNPGSIVELLFVGPGTIPFYKVNGVVYSDLSLIPGWSFTRASSKTALNSAGEVVSFASGVPAITDLGLLVEGTRTNSFLNSAVGATQSVTTTAASWTLSFWGTGSMTLSGAATGTLNGTGTNNRVSLTVTATAASTTLTVTGSITNVQFEAGAYASSYIPTTSGAVTRAADVGFINGLNISNATLAATAAPNNSVDTFRRVASLGDNTATNEAYIGSTTAGQAGGFVFVGGVQQAGFSMGAWSGSQKMAMSFAAGAQAMSFAGGAVTTATGASAPAATYLNLGQVGTGAGAFNGYISSVRVYTPALANSQLPGL